MKDILNQGLRNMGITPPEDAVDKLCRYGELLLEQNQVMNLTAITDPTDVARLWIPPPFCPGAPPTRPASLPTDRWWTWVLGPDFRGWC